MPRGVAGPVPNRIDVLPEIDVPAVVLAGEKDAAFAGASHVMAAKLPEAFVREVERYVRARAREAEL